MPPLETWQFALIFVGVIILGFLLFLVTGYIKIKKGYIAIIERAGLYCGTYRSGVIYFAPILYRRVGMYKLGEIKQTYTIKNQDYILTYEIENFKTFHYVGNHDVESILKASLSDSPNSLSDTLQVRYQKIGVNFKKLEKVKKV